MASTKPAGLARARIGNGFKLAPTSRPGPRTTHARLNEFATARPFGPLQAKLTIGQANDRHEAEADRVADAVASGQDAVMNPGVNRATGISRFGADATSAATAAGRDADVPGSRLAPDCVCGGVCPKCREQATARDDAGRGRAGERGLAAEEAEEPRVLRGAAAPDLQMDLAVTPAAPTAVAATLSQTRITAAITYNARRFIDPFSLSIVRDVVGIPRHPAVSDRALALAVAQWQANHRLPQDGKIGPVTTRTLVRELRGENQRWFARLLREDNWVDWRSVSGPRRGTCGSFRWNVQWGTPLRDGWIIQRVDTTFNATSCRGTRLTAVFTARFWEAWWVNNRGVARRPTSVATPPTTTAIGPGGDDHWGHDGIRRSRGTWSTSARLYTTLTLPAAFAIGSVPDAHSLPATTGPVRSDDLGLVAASRRRGGRWDCCDANPANHFHRPA